MEHMEEIPWPGVMSRGEVITQGVHLCKTLSEGKEMAAMEWHVKDW